MDDYKRMVAPLTADNYDVWSLRMEMLLKLKGLWKVVQSGAALGEERKAEEAWSLIGLHLSDTYLPRVRDKTAKEVWDDLDKLFKAKSSARIVALKTQLNSIRKKDNEAVVEYASRVQALAQELTALGKKQDDEDVSLAILSGLPAHFETIVQILSNDPESLESVEKVVTALKQTEDRLNGGQAASSGDTNKAYVMTDDECWYCSKKGHIRSRCRKFKQDLAAGLVDEKGKPINKEEKKPREGSIQLVF